MSPIQTQIIIMFIMMAVGFVCGKCGVITKDVNRGLSNLCLMVVNPLTIFTSYQSAYSNETAVNLLHTFILAAVAFAIQIAMSVIFIRRRGDEFRIERMSVMLSNCSYMGIPLVQSVYGASGVIYITAFITVFNLITWTYGLALMSGERDVKKMLRSFLNPALIAVFAGVICFFTQIRLPGVLLSTVKTVGGINTPLAMLIAGSTLAHTKFAAALSRWKTYYICALKLLIIPAVVMLALRGALALGADRAVVNIVLIAAACPTATIVTMFCHRYGKNSVYSSELFAICTLLSAITLPVVMKLASLIGF